MIGILTFYWADNYGAMLQAYALKRHLEKLGEQVCLIPYAPHRLTAGYRLCPFGIWMEKGSPRLFFPYGIFLRNVQTIGTFLKRRARMRGFRRRYLTSARPVRKAKNLSLLSCESLLIGSDQVWNPEITFGLDDAYVGNIPRRGDCRISSYGASFGGARLSEDDQEKFIRCVGGFHGVSVRERSGAELARRLLGREVDHVLDPSLLLERSEWEEIGVLPSEKDYILLYLASYSKPLLCYAQSLAARLGKTLIAFSNPASAYYIRDFEPPSGAGPAEFIGYIQNACCVVTNSFHGTALSILFEKPFLTYCRGARDIRQKELLEQLGMRSHLMDVDKVVDPMEIWAETDWEQVKLRLAGRREQSKRFIAEHI